LSALFNACEVLAANELAITVFIPVVSPRVLQKPVIRAAERSEANADDSMASNFAIVRTLVDSSMPCRLHEGTEDIEPHVNSLTEGHDGLDCVFPTRSL
jgi:hypothetical protein